MCECGLAIKKYCIRDAMHLSCKVLLIDDLSFNDIAK